MLLQEEPEQLCGGMTPQAKDCDETATNLATSL